MAVSTHPPIRQVPSRASGAETELSYEQRRQAAASAVAMVEATLGHER